MRRDCIKLAIVVVLMLALSCNQKPSGEGKSTQPANPTSTPAPVAAVSPERMNEVEGERVGGKEPSFKPRQGYVPDEQTAIKIAEAVWLPIYGEDVLKDERPFRAYLKDGVWIVSGTLPTGALGGTAEARISKSTGCILRIIHYQ
jgi:hypothetical protein